MLMRPFSRRERFLLLMLALVLTGAVYLMAIQLPVSTGLAAAQERQAQLDTEMIMAQAKAQSYAQMKAELEQIMADDKQATVMPEYDNIQPLMNRLNQIFTFADSYDLTFEPLSLEESVVRRVIHMTFSCSDYTSAKALLGQFQQTGWRCLMTDLTLVGDGEGDLTESPVSVSASITFFELMP